MSTESNLKIDDVSSTSQSDLHAVVNRNMQATRVHAAQAAEELKNAVEAKGRELLHAADDKASVLKEKAEHAYTDAKQKAEDLRKDTELYVKEHPLTSVCIALGAGFVLGMLARR
ncbi:MAG: ElaB/YqjD/DUF883 family [Verrucomicrobia bacterium]|nr:MAG: ElaB/YqjD/DUF883 family [Verrucomicrobiota bacterium]